MPGDPDGLSQLVTVLRGEATDIRQAISSLSTVNTAEFWEGDAARGFAEARGRAVPDLELVADRIDTSANALAGFVPALGDCQSRGRLAVSRAREAEATILKGKMGLEDAARQAAADQAAADAFAQANPGVAPPPPPAYWGPNWNGIIEEAEGERAAAARLFHQAVEDYDVAATRCAAALHPAIADDLRNPQHHGLLGGIAHRVGDIGHAAVHLAEEVGERVVEAAEDTAAPYVDVVKYFADLDHISEGLGVAAMVTGFIPGAQGAALALNTAKLALDAGRGDWDEVKKDAVGFAALGVGRALTSLSRTATAADAVRKVANDATTIRQLTSEVTEGEELARKAARIAQLGRDVRQADDVVQDLAQGATSSVWQRTAGVLWRNECPGEAGLSLSRGGAQWARAADTLETISKTKDVFDLGEMAQKHLIGEASDHA